MISVRRSNPLHRLINFKNIMNIVNIMTNLKSIMVEENLKEEFDRLQAHLIGLTGRKLSQSEVFNKLLAAYATYVSAGHITK